MNQSQLARRAGISAPSLWAIENGTTKPEKIRAETLHKLAKALSANIEWIRTGIGEPFSHGTPEIPGSCELLEHFSALNNSDRAALIHVARLLRGKE